jgi:hypothetical protein
VRLRGAACVVALLTFAVSVGAASAHHKPKHVKVTILGFSAKKRTGERLPSDAVLPGRTYRHCANKRLYAFVNFRNMRENQPFEVVWTLNGRRVSKATHRWPASESIVFDQFVLLRAGLYELFVRTDGELRTHGRVTVACR